MRTYEILRQLISFDNKGDKLVQAFLIDNEGKEHVFIFDQIFWEECEDGGGFTSIRLKEVD